MHEGERLRTFARCETLSTAPFFIPWARVVLQRATAQDPLRMFILVLRKRGCHHSGHCPFCASDPPADNGTILVPIARQRESRGLVQEPRIFNLFFCRFFHRFAYNTPKPSNRRSTPCKNRGWSCCGSVLHTLWLLQPWMRPYCRGLRPSGAQTWDATAYPVSLPSSRSYGSVPSDHRWRYCRQPTSAPLPPPLAAPCEGGHRLQRVLTNGVTCRMSLLRNGAAATGPFQKPATDSCPCGFRFNYVALSVWIWQHKSRCCGFPGWWFSELGRASRASALFLQTLHLHDLLRSEEIRWPPVANRSGLT